MLTPLCLMAQQSVEPSWESLNQRGYPQWFSDAKLGIFIHWGLYSVPAYASKEGYAEWFYRGLMTGDAGRRRIMSLYADTTLPVFEQYAALTNHWHGELWNLKEWATLFKDAGARYVMLVTKHHDGYCLWDSPYQPTWNSTMSGPRRNIVEELTDAVRQEGLRMCFYYSLPEWSNPRHIWMQDPDDSIADYVDNYMIPQFKELVSRYRPDAIFADGDWQNSAEQWHAEELISWYYNTVGPHAIVNDRWGRGTQHGFKTPEYSQGLYMQDVPWAECRGIGRSFGFNRNEDLGNFLTDDELIQHFCELVSHGGGLTLNVGPMADGTIPFIQQQRLRSLGKWLHVNGEAIYGSTEWVFDRRAITTSMTSQAKLPESAAIDFDWVRNAPVKGMPVDNFSVNWEGTVAINTTGDYLLHAEGDDEILVVKDNSDTILYFNHAWAENNASSKTLHLSEGDSLRLAIHYREHDLEATASLSWSRDGGKTFEPVPARWRGTATWRRTLRCFTQKADTLYMIEFNRPGCQLTIDSAPLLEKNSRISLLGTKGELPWSQDSNRRLQIDLSALDPEEMAALDHAWVFRVTKKNAHIR